MRQRSPARIGGVGGADGASRSSAGRRAAAASLLAGALLLAGVGGCGGADSSPAVAAVGPVPTSAGGGPTAGTPVQPGGAGSSSRAESSGGTGPSSGPGPSPEPVPSGGPVPSGVVVPTRPATVVVSPVPGLGPVLADANGLPLYVNNRDTTSRFACVGSCTPAWPPLTVAAGTAPTAGPGVRGSLGTTQRPDGSTQVTLNGQPLYRFVQDTGPGRAQGNGVGDTFDSTRLLWYAVAPDGVPVTTRPSPPGGGN